MIMLPLFENEVKAWLAARGLPVPTGQVARHADEARTIAEGFSCGAVVKALVPTGRRGKAGAVRLAGSPEEAGAAAAAILVRRIEGFPVAAVYVEERIDIREEFFLSFSLTQEGPKVFVSTQGGVEIDMLFEKHPEAIVHDDIDPLHGLPVWRAIDLWCRSGVTHAALLPKLGALTARLYDAFQAADALTLEINPLVVTPDENLCLVGAMMAVDEYALFRHPQWRDAAQKIEPVGNEREHRVRMANAAYPGGEAQYVELGGDIGLFVGGGGAGLYLHDLIVEMGGRPANHCVTPPTGSDTRKTKAVLLAILSNPATCCLLVGFNFAQMARADVRLRALTEVLMEQSIDTRGFPIVVRLFGAGEEEARMLASAFPGITYMPRGSSLRQAAAEIVRLSSAIREKTPL